MQFGQIKLIAGIGDMFIIKDPVKFPLIAAFRQRFVFLLGQETRKHSSVGEVGDRV